jgi:hypothetical protein
MLRSVKRRQRAPANVDAGGKSAARPTEGIRDRDRVRIRSPAGYQANRGTIIRIGTSRITVETRNGSKIVRAPHNLIFLKMNEDEPASSPAAQDGGMEPPSSGGRGGRGRGRRGRGRGRGNRNRGHNRSATSAVKTTATVFEGNTDGMKGSVFQYHGENIDKQQFLKTVGVLEEHINKTFTYPQDVASVCKSFEVVTLVQPANLSKEDYEKDMGKKMIWEITMKTYMKRVDLLESNTRAIYAIVWGQYSPMMQSKVESLNAFESKSAFCDCIWLLKEIQGITHRFEGTRNVFISLDDAWSNYYGCRQGHKQTLHEYLKDFQGLVQVLEHYGAALGADRPYQDSVKAQVRKDNPGLMTDEYDRRAVAAAKKKSVAIVF